MCRIIFIRQSFSYPLNTGDKGIKDMRQKSFDAGKSFRQSMKKNPGKFLFLQNICSIFFSRKLM